MYNNYITNNNCQQLINLDIIRIIIYYQSMISKDNTTFNFVIPKDLKEKLEARAKEEGRSIGNLLVKLIKDYLSGNSSPS